MRRNKCGNRCKKRYKITPKPQRTAVGKRRSKKPMVCANRVSIPSRFAPITKSDQKLGSCTRRFGFNQLTDKTNKLRRSCRISTKNQQIDYCENSAKKQVTFHFNPTNIRSESPRNSSKSLLNFLSRNLKEINLEFDFNKNLSILIQNCSFRQDPSSITRNLIMDDIRNINNSLDNKMEVTPTMQNMMRLKSNDVDFNISEMNLFDKSEWSYETPPKQKLNFSLQSETELKAAVFVNNNHNLFELKENVNPTLISHFDRKNIPIDGRYMKLVNGEESDREVPGNEAYNFKPPLSFLDEHVLTLTTRPKKTVQRIPLREQESAFNAMLDASVEKSMDFSFVDGDEILPKVKKLSFNESSSFQSSMFTDDE